MNSNIKKICVSSLIFILGLFSLDFIVGGICNYLQMNLPKSGEGAIVKMNYLVNDINQDIIIYGSSNASHNYIPSLIKNKMDSLLQKEHSIYNAGVDGHDMIYQACWIECMLKRHLPKLIIWDCNDNDLNLKDVKLNDLGPYATKNEIVDKYIKKLDFKEQLKLSFNMTRYNEAFLKYLYGIYTSNKLNDGYAPLYKRMSLRDSKQIISKKNEEYQISELAENSLKNILSICKEKNIKIILTASPLFGSKDKNEHIASICKSYNIPYIDMFGLDCFNNHNELFQDRAHLNNDGAKVCTEYLLNNLIYMFNTK